MTDRVKGLTITLESDIRIEDISPLMNAILQMKGVIDVSPIISNASDSVVKLRCRQEMREKLYTLISEI